MNLIISGHHLEVTPALREYVTNKLDCPLRHFDKNPTKVTIKLSVEKLKEKERRQTAQATVHFKGKEIVVGASHEDLYAAIDRLMAKLNRQIGRHKDRQAHGQSNVDRFLDRMEDQGLGSNHDPDPSPHEAQPWYDTEVLAAHHQ